ncbi:MAG: nuclear transport factor 2 family protein [Gammaproteobacteria bacterium]|nr:nuclear transport factor 2 family protein [Gammaproteobacteria bacterium]
MAVALTYAPLTRPVIADQTKAADDPAPIRAAAEQFLRVFDDLDWEPFRASWAAEPSVFFPFDDTPERVTGRAAVEARFRRLFDETRARTPGPPYLHLKPRELRVERYGDAGLVTFMLGGPGERIGRRTLFFVRENGTWKLAHLHASNVDQP